MAVKSASGTPIPEHSILARLLAAGGSELKVFRGYVGPSVREGYLSVYPSLAELGRSYEIRGEDIVHVEEIPAAFAPFGAVMLWVQPGADVAARVVESSTRKASASRPEMVEVRRGRLRMQRRSPVRARDDDCATCTSNCDCSSDCDVCVSICTWTCEPRPV